MRRSYYTKRREDGTVERVYPVDARPGVVPLPAQQDASLARASRALALASGGKVFGTVVRPINDTSKPAIAPMTLDNAGRMFKARIGQVADPVPQKGAGPYKQLVRPKAEAVTSRNAAVGSAKPSLSLQPSEAKTIARKGVDLHADKGAMCRAVNRPDKTSGDGGSRSFIPWCAKGKRGK